MKVFRVLIVDDDAVGREATSAVLSDDFEVKTCAGARDALRLLEHEVFHVVCSDWRMPEMDGLEFFRAMLQQPGLPPTACILFTAFAEDLASLTPSANRKTLGVVRKPCPPERLIGHVRHYANIAEMRRTIRDLNILAHSDSKVSGT